MLDYKCNINMSLPSPIESYATATISLLLALVTIPGNFLVCLAVLKSSNKNIRNPFNYFVLSLAVADLVVGCITEPLAVYVHVKEATRMSIQTSAYNVEVECLHLSYFISCTTSVLSICLLGIERYVAITSPLKFRLFFSVRRFLLLATVVWLVSVGLSSIYLFTTYAIYALVFSTNAVVWTMSVSIFTYTKIVRKFNERLRSATLSSTAHRRDKPSSKMKPVQESNPSVRSGTSPPLNRANRSPSRKPLSPNVNSKRGHPSCLESMGHRRNVSSPRKMLSPLKQRIKQPPPNSWNVKLTKTYLVIISIFLACYIPACAIIYTMKLCSTCTCTELQYLQDLQFVIIAFQSALNPFVYAFRFKRFRRAVLQILRCRSRSRFRSGRDVTFRSNTTLTKSTLSLESSIRKNISAEL